MLPYSPPTLPANETERLEQLRQFDVLDTPDEADFDDFTQLASELLGTPIALISLIDENRQWFKSRVGLDATETPRAISFCGHAIHSTDLLVVEDATQDARFAQNPLVTSDPNIRFYAGCPLVTRSGHVIGTLCVIDEQPRQLSPSDADTLKRLGRQLMHLFELRRQLRVEANMRQLLETRNVEQKRLALVAERTQNVVIMSDPEGKVIWVNPAFERLTGYSLQDAMGRKPGELLQFSGTHPNARAALSEAIRLKQSARVQILNRGKTGNVYWIDVDMQPHFDSDGELLGFVAVETDITHLIQQREHTQTLLANMPVGLIELDIDGAAVFANPAARCLLGLGPGDPIGPLPQSWMDAADLTKGSESHLPAKLYPLHLPGTATRWIEVSAAPLRGLLGETKGVILTLSDETQKTVSERYIDVANATVDIGYWNWQLPEDVLELSDAWIRHMKLDSRLTSSRWLVHPEDQVLNKAVILEVLKGERDTFRFEERLRFGQDDWRWVITGGAVTERDAAGRAVRLAGIHLDIHDRKTMENQLQLAATTDALTGLPNRQLLNDRLEQALQSARRHQRRGALLFMDLDHFKRVNDSYGHAVGDQLLVQIAERLRNLLRAEDTLARMGGDELLVLLPELHGDLDQCQAQALNVGAKLLKAFEAPFRIGGIDLTINSSIGVSVFPKHEQETADDLIREADTAMYSVKGTTRGNVRLFESSMHGEVSHRMMLEMDLRHALVEPQFQLFLQGKWTADRQLKGAEALIRWNHPKRGWVSPMEFIGVAEDSGLILPVGLWVLQEACRAAIAIRRHQPDFVVSVNVSPKQFQQPAFAQQLRRALQEAHLPPDALMIEITEGVLLQSHLAEQVLQLSNEGFLFSLDDFGTGYSSLAYLKRLPVHELKIDRAFVRDIETDPSDAALVQAILSIAHQFQIRTVAEGVETHTQANLLNLSGCQLLQGYLFDQPAPWVTFMERFIQKEPLS